MHIIFLSNDWDGDGDPNVTDPDDDNDGVDDEDDGNPFDRNNGGGSTVQAGGATPDKIECTESFCFALIGGDVWSVGSNYRGQLAMGDNVDRNTWTKTSMSNADEIFVGYNTGFVLKGGVPWGVGWGAYGMLGTGNGNNSTEFVQSNISGVDKLAVGGYSTHALVNGEIFSVGSNSKGRLGIAKTSGFESTWTKALNISGVTDIFATSQFTLALNNDAVQGTGGNQYTQLGLGHSMDVSVFTESNLKSADSIDGGVYASYAMVAGEVFTTGYNSYDKGMGRQGNASKTFQTTGQTGVDAVTGGRNHFAVLKNGKVYTHGYLPGYQNDYLYKEAPLEGTALSIEASDNGLYAITDKGVFFIGRNLNGLGGLGHEDPVSEWTQVFFNE